MNLIVIPMGLFISLSVKGVVDNTLVAQSMHLGYALITTRAALTDMVEDNEISRESTCIHEGLSDLVVKIINKSDTRDPTARESFWVHKYSTFLPYWLNLQDLYVRFVFFNNL